jgi:demethylmenaquinone methyltransferase / 2-methoxy-6-polyprenyl-1,4-benzoquinol methylase
VTDRTRQAQRLFAPLGPTYDRYASLLSFGQDPLWRRFLVSRIEAGPGDRVLDVATGTGAVARELIRQKGCSVVGVDQSAEMLSEARRRLNGHAELVEASAESLPFADGEFDALTLTYLLRYVDDPAATLVELARVLKPGGALASLEFAVPGNAGWHAAWVGYTRGVLPAAGMLTGGREWARVGSFLGPSISGHYRAHPVESIVGYWRDAGIEDVRTKPMSLGGGLVMSGRKAAAPETDG